MNKKGFSLIEILAVIIIIAIGGTIAVASISSNILKSKDQSVIDLAKNYLESARTMRASDDFYYNPKKDEAIILPCDQVNGTEIEHKDSTSYGDLLPEYCYVGVANDGNNKYSYYMTMVDKTYHMLVGADYNTLSDDDILIGFENIAGVRQVKAPLTGFGVNYDSNQYRIKSARIKFSVKYNDGIEKTATLYGYYSTESTTSSNADIKGTISEFDSLIENSYNNNNKITVKGKEYTVEKTEILYIVVKK